MVRLKTRPFLTCHERRHDAQWKSVCIPGGTRQIHLAFFVAPFCSYKGVSSLNQNTEAIYIKYACFELPVINWYPGVEAILLISDKLASTPGRPQFINNKKDAANPGLLITLMFIQFQEDLLLVILT